MRIEILESSANCGKESDSSSRWLLRQDCSLLVELQSESAMQQSISVWDCWLEEQPL